MGVSGYINGRYIGEIVFIGGVPGMGLGNIDRRFTVIQDKPKGKASKTHGPPKKGKGGKIARW